MAECRAYQQGISPNKAFLLYLVPAAGTRTENADVRE
jgi:hypothetical protein